MSRDASFDSARDAGQGGETSPLVLDGASVRELTIPGADFILTADYSRQGGDLILNARDGSAQVIIRDFFADDTPPTLFSDSGARVSGELATKLAGPMAPGQYAQNGSIAQAEAIGRVESVTGQATAIRTDGSRVELHKDSAIYKGDTVETSEGASLGIVFIDKGTFAIGENARMVLDELIYDPPNGNFSSSVSLLQGAFVILSGGIGKANPGGVAINTPVATIGIRGTHFALDIKQIGSDSLFTLLRGAIEVANAATSVLLSEAGLSTTFSSFNLPSGPVFQLTEAQLGAAFGSVLGISAALAPFSVNPPDEITPESGGNPTGGGHTGNQNVSQGALASLGLSSNPFSALLQNQFSTFGDGTTDSSDGRSDLVGEVVGATPEGGVVIQGDENDNDLQGSNGTDVISGRGGDDVIIGNGGDDTLFGNEGNDLFLRNTGDGNDIIEGGVVSTR